MSTSAHSEHVTVPSSLTSLVLGLTVACSKVAWGGQFVLGERGAAPRLSSPSTRSTVASSRGALQCMAASSCYLSAPRGLGDGARPLGRVPEATDAGGRSARTRRRDRIPLFRSPERLGECTASWAAWLL
jgi:hypothetical protein